MPELTNIESMVESWGGCRSLQMASVRVEVAGRFSRWLLFAGACLPSGKACTGVKIDKLSAHASLL